MTKSCVKRISITTFTGQREFLNSISSREKIQLGIIDREYPKTICGIVSVSSINYINRNAEIAGIQSAQTRSNPAIFIEAWSIMLRHAFDQLGMHKIYGGTFHPHVSTSLTRIFNFEKEGVRKKHIFKNGEFHDAIMLAVFSNTVRYPVL